ncbi:hypothetical protein [Chryseobacterium sp. Leaf180]|uniref:hypothetical protein n=1 Tax=Chryseobacterium sp. Leaf180 TaxID=1736289 RepID=UPI000A53A363|nr:hypothetical protein [Chryseobacterium sp. Leaf180]
MVKNVEPKEIILSTGKRCTHSGEWELKGSITTTVYVSKGQLMPEYCGKKVQWVIITLG